MITITESLDTALIERLRRQALGRGLDEKDDFSYHQVLWIEGEPFGTARFFREGGGVRLDSVAVDSRLPGDYHEMLSRSMVAHALDCGAERIFVCDEAEFYAELGFVKQPDGSWTAASGDVKFPCKCKGL